MRAVRTLAASAPVALEFLTPLRLRRVRRRDDATFANALGWYPAVGLLLGLALLAIDAALAGLLPPEPRSAVLLAALALLSAGLHLDGVADTADGMALQGDRGDRLSVMSEGAVGPAGAMALAIVLIVQWAALAAIAEPLRPAAIVLAPALARWTPAPLAALFRPARPRGLGAAMRQGAWPLAAPLSALIAFGASAALLGPAGLALPVIAAAAGLILAAAAARMLDGVTGDTFGAAIEVAQAASLLAFAAASEGGWIAPTPPW